MKGTVWVSGQGLCLVRCDKFAEDCYVRMWVSKIVINLQRIGMRVSRIVINLCPYESIQNCYNLQRSVCEHPNRNKFMSMCELW